MKASAGEVYTVYNQYLKRYTACQVAYIAPPDTVSKEPWAGDSLPGLGGGRPSDRGGAAPSSARSTRTSCTGPRDLHLLRVPVEGPTSV